MTIKLKNNEIPYFLSNGNLGSIKDLLLLSLKEQEEQINKFIDDCESHRPKGRCFCVISHTIFF